MTTEPPRILSRLLYVSTVCADAGRSAVVDIATAAREHNFKTGITGLLVFDGREFAQFLEGEPHALDDLLRKLRVDVRHHNVLVLSLETLATARRFPSWDLGYLGLEGRQNLADLRKLRGQAAMTAFEAMLPSLDVTIGFAMPPMIRLERLTHALSAQVESSQHAQRQSEAMLARLDLARRRGDGDAPLDAPDEFRGRGKA